MMESIDLKGRESNLSSVSNGMGITLGLATGLSRVTTSCLWLGRSLSNSFGNSLCSTTKLSARLTWVATSRLSLWIGLSITLCLSAGLSRVSASSISITLRLSARLSGVSAASITLRFSTWLSWVTTSCLCFAAGDFGGLFVFDLEAVVVCLWVFLGLGDNGGKVTGETLGFEACTSNEVTSGIKVDVLGGAGLSKSLGECFSGALDLSTRLTRVTASCFGLWDGITLSARLAWVTASCLWLGDGDTLCFSARLTGVTTSCLWRWNGITLSARLAWMTASCVSDWVGKCDSAD
jgi:hypothetical protein